MPIDDFPRYPLTFGRSGIPVESTVEATRLSGRLEGMIIDPVYEGKSMAGLVDLVTGGDISSDSTDLYAHLGGQPPSTPTAESSRTEQRRLQVPQKVR